MATTAPYAEPWLSGTYSDVPAVPRAVLHALDQARDDVKRWTEGLSDLEIHARPFGLMAVASQIKHMAGSIDRLVTYAEGGQLSDEQLRVLKVEQSGGETLAELLNALESSLDQAAARVRAFGAADFNTPRTVGRKQLPTTLGGALVHVADHTMRHVGQLVTTSKVLKALHDQGVS